MAVAQPKSSGHRALWEPVQITNPGTGGEGHRPRYTGATGRGDVALTPASSVYEEHTEAQEGHGTLPRVTEWAGMEAK